MKLKVDVTSVVFAAFLLLGSVAFTVARNGNGMIPGKQSE